MEMNEMILISVDDHVIEPPDAFQRHMPAKFKSRAPFVESVDNQDYWNFDGRRFVLSGLNAVAGRPRDEYGIEATSFRDIRPGAYDVRARIDDMNANGIVASMCFPSIVGFGGGLGRQLPDPEFALAVVRAYNDWHIEDWAGAAPGRLIPLAILPAWDIALSVAEAQRLAGLGIRAIAFSENPAYSGQTPSIHSPAWDPLWKVCADNAIALCLHIGTGAQPPTTTDDEPVNAWMTTIPMSTCFPAADWLHGPMWRKFPALKVVLSEAGIGWVPYMLERADFIYDHHRAWTHTDFGGSLPSEVFRKHFVVCFTDDKYGVKNCHEVGLPIITWECDYPHSDCTWPHSPELLWENVKHLSRPEIDQITHLNAIREFGFDPIAALGRDACTVEALRRAAAHVDTCETRGLGGTKPGGTSQITVGEMKAQLAKQRTGVEAA